MKTIELLNKVVELGFSREKALADIDASLDEVIGAENRKPILVQSPAIKWEKQIHPALKA